MEVDILQNTNLRGNLEIPNKAMGVVVLANSGNERELGSQNDFVTSELNKAGLATLQVVLLSEEENKISKNRSNLDLLTERLIGVTKWCMEKEETQKMNIGYWGNDIGSAVVLSAATYWGTKIKAVVSLAGQTDLAMEDLDLIEAPVLLIVGGEDKEKMVINRKAYIKIGCTKKMEVIVGATDLFKEESFQKKVVELAKNWLQRFLLEESVK